MASDCYHRGYVSFASFLLYFWVNLKIEKAVLEGVVLGPIIVCSNDYPGLTLTYFKAMSNLVT